MSLVLSDLGTSTRIKSAKETLSAIEPYLTECDINGYADHSLDGCSIKSIEVFRGNPRSGYLNLGKGFSFEAALASGYMEAIEMHTIEFPPKIPLCIPPPDTKLYPTTHAIEATSNAYAIRGYDLITGKYVYSLASTHFLIDAKTSENVSTNGLASGNSVQEAQLHACYELIERHLISQSLKNTKNIKRIDLGNTKKNLLKAIEETNSHGMRVELYSLGETLGVQVIQCVLVSVEALPTEVHFGWGAHHSIGTAISRSIAEAMQAWSTRLACRSNTLPDVRKPGGILLSRDILKKLSNKSSVGELHLWQRLSDCPIVCHSSSEDKYTSLSSPDEALERIISYAKRSKVPHIYSWTLSPKDRPYSVVKCAIPYFDSLF